MDQRTAIFEIFSRALRSKESLENYMGTLMSLRMAVYDEVDHVTDRATAIDDKTKEVFELAAEMWECSFEEAVSRSLNLNWQTRYSEPNEDALQSVSYQEYLKSSHWRGVREYALLRADYRCQLCNSSKPLDVHHRTYEGKGAEDYRDVIALCRDCHAKFHGKENDRR